MTFSRKQELPCCTNRTLSEPQTTSYWWTDCYQSLLLTVPNMSVEELAQRGDYKGACRLAVSLRSFQYPIETFCLPLLLTGQIHIAQNYLDNSQDHQRQFVKYLDNIVGRILTIGALKRSYPKVKPTKKNELTVKHLSDLTKRLVKRWNVPETEFPHCKEKWAQATIHYSFINRSEVPNWREILIRVGVEDEFLCFILFNTVSRHDVEEGKYLMKMIKSNQTLPTEMKPSTVSGVGYLELPFSVEKIRLVDSQAKLLEFLSSVDVFAEEPGRHIGLDVEYFHFLKFQKKRLSLIQVSLEEEIFLLDWVSLRSVLSEGDVLALRDKVLLNNNLLIVGFGVTEDMDLLSESLPGCEDVLERGQHMVDLLHCRDKLCQLVGVEVKES